MVTVKFGQSEANNKFISASSAKDKINIEWKGDPNQLYTLIMYDLDAPYPYPRNFNSPYLHWIVTNIKGSDISTGDEGTRYIAPSPPPDSLPHTYNVDIYLQPNKITPVRSADRNNFDVDGFVKTYRLKLVDQGGFKTGSIVPTKKSLERKKITPDSVVESESYFIPDADLSEREKKWCRCVLKVADKQKGRCNTERAWRETRDGKTCYNPYAICSKSVGTSTRKCSQNYNFSAIPDDYLISYAQLHQKPKNGMVMKIPEPYNREQMLKNIETYFSQK